MDGYAKELHLTFSDIHISAVLNDGIEVNVSYPLGYELRKLEFVGVPNNLNYITSDF